MFRIFKNCRDVIISRYILTFNVRKLFCFEEKFERLTSSITVFKIVLKGLLTILLKFLGGILF